MATDLERGQLVALDRPVMTAREAARQLKIPSATLAGWLEGRDVNGRFYPPVLREEPLGHLDMTWGEVVEAKYLRAYRDLNVSLQKLRPFIALLRQEFGVPYPLAHFKPFVENKRNLLLDLQDEAGVPDELWLIMRGPASGQYLLNPTVRREFLSTVEFATEGLEVADRLRPFGPGTPVVIDPRRSSGAATVRGVRCEILAERMDAGENIDDVAEEFGLKVDEVRQALSFVWQQAA